MPLSHGINVFEVWGCQVGARWVQREPLGGHVETLWAHLGLTMGIFGALLGSLFPGPFPRPVFGEVRPVFGKSGCCQELSGCCRALSGCCRGAVVWSRGQGQRCSGWGGDSFGDPFTGLSEGNSIRLAASFGTGAADLKGFAHCRRPPSLDPG